MDGKRSADFELTTPQHKVRKVIVDELNQYKYSSPDFSQGNHNSLLNDLIRNNMELNSQITEFKLSNKYIQEKILEVEQQNHIKNNYANSQMEEIKELKENILGFEKEKKKNLESYQKAIRIINLNKLIISSLFLAISYLYLYFNFNQ